MFKYISDGSWSLVGWILALPFVETEIESYTEKDKQQL